MRRRPLTEKIKMATMRAQPRGMFMRFTDRSRRALHLDQEEARLLRHHHVGPEHRRPRAASGGAATMSRVGATDESARDLWARRASSFGRQAAAYAEHRPDYARAAVDWALEPARGSGRLRVLDVGAGTGKLTAMIARLAGPPQVSVVAVEPDPAMLAELRRRVPAVTSLPGTAEDIPLPDASVDAVLCGQAAHWFTMDLAVPEVARVLAPGGVFAGLWNMDDDREDWVAGLCRVCPPSVTVSSWTAGRTTGPARPRAARCSAPPSRPSSSTGSCTPPIPWSP